MQTLVRALSCKLLIFGNKVLASYCEANNQHSLEIASVRAKLSSVNNKQAFPFKT